MTKQRVFQVFLSMFLTVALLMPLSGCSKADNTIPGEVNTTTEVVCQEAENLRNIHSSATQRATLKASTAQNMYASPQKWTDAFILEKKSFSAA